MSDVIIYHNPRCSKSRQTLQLLQERNIEPEVVLYLETPPAKDTLIDILAKLNIPARKLLRTGEAEYKNNNLKNPELTEDELIEAMTQWPKIIERPIVLANNQARIGRPPESVLEIV